MSLINMRNAMMAGSVTPSVFRYLGIKIIAVRRLRNFASLSALRADRVGTANQISEVFFKNENTRYSFQSDVMASVRFAFDGMRSWQEWVLLSTILGGSQLLPKLFDGSTSTKMCVQSPFFIRDSRGTRRVLDYDTGEVLLPDYFNVNESSVVEMTQRITGAPVMPGIGWHLTPTLVVLDMRNEPLDIGLFPTWGFCNSNDITSQRAGQWVEGEILGSTDLTSWWRLDVFNSLTLPVVNYGVAYTGSLVPRTGDPWSDLDLATRNWSSGIAVDTVQ